jgi:transmembrane 9 superfamily protein 2/4
MASENLGEFLTGNKIQSSAYSINMLREVFCQVLCQVTLNDAKMVRSLVTHIKYGYHHNWIIDNLPSAQLGTTASGERLTHYAGGFPIGYYHEETKEAYIYNHVNIMLEYHNPEGKVGHRVVGFKVEPMSIAHRYSGGYIWDGESSEGFTKPLTTCREGAHTSFDFIPENQLVTAGATILYTYDVIWNYSETAWASRWDVYLSEDHMVPAQVHWYSITNSIMVVLFLSVLVVSILVRNLRKDIAGYNALEALTDEEKEEEAEESGWKLIHADVFRPPSTFPMLYCVMVGSGSQIGLCAFFTICLAAVGFLSPARRGSLMTAILVFYMLCGSLAGYVSSRLYKCFQGRQWQLCTLLTGTAFPGLCFIIFLFFNTILAFFHSTASVPFLDLVIVAAMWCCISVPLVFLGAYFGFKMDYITFPTVTSSIARAIPEPTTFTKPIVSIFLGGLIPFAAAYVELFFIMTSLWMDQFYYVFGFTLAVYIILLITCAEITALLTYYQLCAENHRWWWFSFFTAGSAAIVTFLYSFVWFGSLDASKMLITYMLYFGYMFLICTALLLVTGSVGMLTSFWFVRKIFSTIKVD